MTVIDHLGDETIAAMLEGALPGETAERARAHIASCDACRQMVSAAIGANAVSRKSTVAGIEPGNVIADRYRIDRFLGEGGVGRVFAAHQRGLERPVAIKILLPEYARDVHALARFQREARAIALLTSEHVVRVHDLGELATGEPYLVMELLEGEDLAQVVARGPVPIAQAVAWIGAACEAIGEAHALGILHRDLKPSNLFVTRRGQLKVLDFGLAKLATTPSLAMTSVTAAGMAIGSPRYMAPEQITNARDIDARADVWALGATLYHLITGRPPFAEQSLEAIFGSILSGRLPPMTSIPPKLAQVIQRALARDPAARYASVAELRAALASATAPRSSARGLMIAAASVGTIAGTAAFIIALRGGPAQNERVAGSDAWQQPAAPAATPPPASRTGGNGPLGNMTVDRLRHRLEKLGWHVDETSRYSYGCDHTRFVASWPSEPQRWADVTLLVCPDREGAASEGRRLRGMPGGWVVDDDTLVLDVGTNTTVGSDEKQSKLLFDALVAP